MTDLLRQFSGVSFGGVSAAQYFVDFYLWEAVLNENPNIRGIIELGTWMGGFSHFLNAQAQVRGIEFRTFDSVVHFSKPVPNFIQLDIFANEDYVADLIRSFSPVALLCDNGNKPREISTFSKYCNPQDVIFVHDWLTEFMPQDIPENCVEIYADFCDRLGSVTRVLKVKS